LGDKVKNEYIVLGLEVVTMSGVDLNEEKIKLKAAMDGLIAELEVRKARGKPLPDVQMLVENAMTALLFGDVEVAGELLAEAAEKLGIEEEGEPAASTDDDLPPPEEIEDLIAYFAERIEECVKKGINTEKTLNMLLQAQEAFENGDMENAWRAARTGIKVFEMEMECLEEENK